MTGTSRLHPDRTIGAVQAHPTSVDDAAPAVHKDAPAVHGDGHRPGAAGRRAATRSAFGRAG